MDENPPVLSSIRLEPGKTYVIWINSRNNNAFRDTKGNPAAPCLLVFKTK
jgi:hypothetical protein